MAETSACTRVLGFSQTGGWYKSGFEQVVIDGAWELYSASGASITQWADPSSRTWATATTYSPCPFGPPDRVLLTITGTAGSRVSNWVVQINQAIATIRAKLPSVAAIILQPVIGGPDHGLCYVAGMVVRAAFNHPFIDQAISQVVAQGDPAITVGASPEVASCTDYVDVKGHITAAASAVVAADLGVFYAGR
ncbi:MAG: hypothetical protein ACT4PO_02620 [Actinomycetota bacterium]